MADSSATAAAPDKGCVNVLLSPMIANATGAARDPEVDEHENNFPARRTIEFTESDWGEDPIADAPLPGLFSLYET